jgi:iron complex transport system substrate-binding protein
MPSSRRRDPHARAFGLQPDQLTSYPTWTVLPAVRAGQVGRWSAEVRLSAQGYTDAFEELAATVRNVQVGIA